MTPLLKLVLLGLVLAILAGAGGFAAATYYHRQALAKREIALRKDVEKYAGELGQQTQIITDAKADAQRARQEASRHKQEAARLLREHQTLQAEVDRLASVRQTAREEVSRVPESEIRSRVRIGLLRLRAGAPGPGG